MFVTHHVDPGMGATTRQAGRFHLNGLFGYIFRTAAVGRKQSFRNIANVITSKDFNSGKNFTLGQSRPEWLIKSTGMRSKEKTIPACGSGSSQNNTESLR